MSIKDVLSRRIVAETAFNDFASEVNQEISNL
jgi:hypothetical protein